MEDTLYTSKMAEPEIFRSLELEEGSEKRVSVVPRVLKVLASVLEKMIQKNERSNQEGSRRESITIFHGSRAPSMSIRQYTERIYKYTCCSPSCFVMAYVYIQRYLKKMEAGLTLLNVHRLLITTVMVAAKFMDDETYDNAYYAKVGGVSNAELNRLELKLLFDLDFGLNVSKEAFEKYCLKLQKEGSRSNNVKPIIACGLREESLANRYPTSHASDGPVCGCHAI